MSLTVRYHSPLRAEPSAATHARIVEACAAILRSGSSLTSGAVAAPGPARQST